MKYKYPKKLTNNSLVSEDYCEDSVLLHQPQRESEELHIEESTSMTISQSIGGQDSHDMNKKNCVKSLPDTITFKNKLL